YLPDINGVVSSVELLRKKLTEMGNTVYVICSYKGGSKIRYEGNIIRLPGVEIKKIYGYALSTPLHFLFIEELKKLELDIIHAETEFGVGLLANIAASMLNIPLVRTYHTTYEDYTHYLNIINSKTLDIGLKKGIAQISAIYCNHCVKLISPSEKTAAMLRSYGVSSDIAIIPTGVELERFAAQNVDREAARSIRERYIRNEGEKLLVFVGRIAEEKSIDKIIRAFRRVKESDLKVRLLIVGDGPSLEDLRNLTAEYGLEEYIFFAGKKPFAEVPSYYHAADGFISASTSETQGMTYIEALASGLVVLANYDKVLDDLIIEGKNGYFFSDEEGLFEAVRKFAELTTEEDREMSLQAVQSVRKYDANRFGEDSLALYEEAIEDFRHSYIIKKTKLRDDCVELGICGYDGHEEKLTLSLDDYYSGSYRNTNKLTRLVYLSLKRKEASILAYRASLRRLANRDYSLKEMRDYLGKNYDLDERDIDAIIDHLSEYGLIDDERFAETKVSSLRASFMSQKAIERKLLKLGISREIIEKCIDRDEDTELANAKEKARKYYRSARNRSINLKKQLIYGKLINDGFTSDIAKEAMSSLDFSDSILMEKELLKKEALKAKNRYEKKYEGTELRNRVYLTLVSKGFSYDNIYAIINEMEL
ncbi:MAG: RecX family transcriptional regulator, partial [Erysipelotrichaceae bacterium]|nr:RecX family transcriptional regulator [Erysipelotrichaceae bacterium]